MRAALSLLSALPALAAATSVIPFGVSNVVRTEYEEYLMIYGESAYIHPTIPFHYLQLPRQTVY